MVQADDGVNVVNRLAISLEGGALMTSPGVLRHKYAQLWLGKELVVGFSLVGSYLSPDDAWGLLADLCGDSLPLISVHLGGMSEISDPFYSWIMAVCGSTDLRNVRHAFKYFP